MKRKRPDTKFVLQVNNEDTGQNVDDDENSDDESIPEINLQENKEENDENVNTGVDDDSVTQINKNTREKSVNNDGHCTWENTEYAVNTDQLMTREEIVGNDLTEGFGQIDAIDEAIDICSRMSAEFQMSKENVLTLTRPSGSDVLCRLMNEAIPEWAY